jgi:hypothetical protein
VTDEVTAAVCLIVAIFALGRVVNLLEARGR